MHQQTTGNLFTEQQHNWAANREEESNVFGITDSTSGVELCDASIIFPGILRTVGRREDTDPNTSDFSVSNRILKKKNDKPVTKMTIVAFHKNINNEEVYLGNLGTAQELHVLLHMCCTAAPQRRLLTCGRLNAERATYDIKHIR